MSCEIIGKNKRRTELNMYRTEQNCGVKWNKNQNRLEIYISEKRGCNDKQLKTKINSIGFHLITNRWKSLDVCALIIYLLLRLIFSSVAARFLFFFFVSIDHLD